MRIILLFVSSIALFMVSSCRDDFEFEPSTEPLNFSKSVVYLDTVFTNIGSSTYTLKVYNPSDKNIVLRSVKLGRGENSKYRMTVDGMTGTNNRIFDNVEMLAKDSMFIFIEVTADVADANPGDFLYEDQIEFHHFGGLSTQTVDVVTLIQDAIFIRPNDLDPDPERILKEIIDIADNSTAPVNLRGYKLTDAELNWTNAKPYVVYDWVIVPNNKTLNIAAGTKVHFHKNSGMVVQENATLKINGILSTFNANGEIVVDNYVHFQGDRLEHTYFNVPGQWSALWILSNQDNEINYLKLKNAGVGIYASILNSNSNKPKINIKNSEIYNCSQFGFLGVNAEIDAFNTVINNCGQFSFAGFLGGKYNITHCTFNNSWNNPNQLSLYFSNHWETSDTLFLKPLTEANINNSIIYGNNRIQFFAENKVPSENIPLNFKFNHCLIKFNASGNQLIASNPLFIFTDTSRYVNCTIASDNSNFKPKYKLTKNHPFDLTEAFTIPNDNSFSSGNDILNRARTGQINVGAYQFTP
jgi:hypothetical protein